MAWVASASRCSGIPETELRSFLVTLATDFFAKEPRFLVPHRPAVVKAVATLGRRAYCPTRYRSTDQPSLVTGSAGCLLEVRRLYESFVKRVDDINAVVVLDKGHKSGANAVGRTGFFNDERVFVKASIVKNWFTALGLLLELCSHCAAFLASPHTVTKPLKLFWTRDAEFCLVTEVVKPVHALPKGALLKENMMRSLLQAGVRFAGEASAVVRHNDLHLFNTGIRESTGEVVFFDFGSATVFLNLTDTTYACLCGNSSLYKECASVVTKGSQEDEDIAATAASDLQIFACDLLKRCNGENTALLHEAQTSESVHGLWKAIQALAFPATALVGTTNSAEVEVMLAGIGLTVEKAEEALSKYKQLATA